MYYILTFWEDSGKYKDEQEAKQLINNYTNVDKAVEYLKSANEYHAWYFYLGNSKLTTLEQIIEDITQKDEFKTFEIEVYEDKKTARDCYDHIVPTWPFS